MRIKIAMAWVLLQILFLAGWAAVEKRRVAPGVGTSILVRVVPVDPRDLLRGQYVRLGYEFSRMPGFADGGGEPLEGQAVWVVLRPEGEFHVPRGMFRTRPMSLAPGETVLRGRSVRWRIEYGIEQYDVPEGTPTPDAKDLTVRLRVGADALPRIEQVYLRGTPWP